MTTNEIAQMTALATDPTGQGADRRAGASTTTYYRIQPRGLGLDHYSETSNGETADGLHVLTDERHVVSLDCGQSLRAVRRAYGDEIIEITAPGHWDNRDVEGVTIDPAQATIIARYTWAQWLSRVLGRTITRATESAYQAARK